jgi:hypothetical protein
MAAMLVDGATTAGSAKGCLIYRAFTACDKPSQPSI